MTGSVPRPDNPNQDGGSRQKICEAAMKCFGDYGSEAASLRMVANEAGVSIGLVQYHFGSKAALVDAVDNELITILEQASPLREPPPDPVSDISQRLTTFMAEHPDAINYLARLLIDDHETGRRIFDLLLGIGVSQWNHLQERGVLSGDLNPTWGALNPLILALGTLILRSHIERQLPDSFDTPTHRQTWEAAVDNMIRGGQLRE